MGKIVIVGGCLLISSIAALRILYWKKYRKDEYDSEMFIADIIYSASFIGLALWVLIGFN